MHFFGRKKTFYPYLYVRASNSNSLAKQVKNRDFVHIFMVSAVQDINSYDKLCDLDVMSCIYLYDIIFIIRFVMLMLFYLKCAIRNLETETCHGLTVSCELVTCYVVPVYSCPTRYTSPIFTRYLLECLPNVILMICCLIPSMCVDWKMRT